MSKIVPIDPNSPRLLACQCGNCGLIDHYPTDYIEKYCEFDCTGCGAKNMGVFLKFDAGRYYKFGLQPRYLYWN